jgi:hypothetical protein
MMLFLFGCGGGQSDPAALEATITARVIAIQTASAPTVVPTSTPLPSMPAANIPSGWRVFNKSVLPFTFAYPPEWDAPFENAGGAQFQPSGLAVFINLSELYPQWPAGTPEEVGAVILERYRAIGSTDAPATLLSHGPYRDDVRVGYVFETRVKARGFDGVVRTVYIRLRDGSVFTFTYQRDAAALTDPQRETLRQAVSTVRESPTMPIVDLPKSSATVSPARTLTIVPKQEGAPPVAVATTAPTLTELIDAAWGTGDWPRVITLLRSATPTDNDKLYAAYFNYGQALLLKGDKAGAATQFQNAIEVNSSGAEARQAILALTPSPTPTRTAVPLPATATATAAIVIQATPPGNSGIRIGAVCRDGTSSSATGSGACSHHGGVAYWVYR